MVLASGARVQSHLLGIVTSEARAWYHYPEVLTSGTRVWCSLQHVLVSGAAPAQGALDSGLGSAIRAQLLRMLVSGARG
eukprot:6653104-Pyramimonas_sp.AAC.1